MNVTVKRAAFLPAHGLADGVRLDRLVAACLDGQDQAGRMTATEGRAADREARGVGDTTSGSRSASMRNEPSIAARSTLNAPGLTPVSGTDDEGWVGRMTAIVMRVVDRVACGAGEVLVRGGFASALLGGTPLDRRVATCAATTAGYRA